MRLFVAVELSDAVRGHLSGVQARLRAVVDRAAWVREENLHLTLKFLGEVDEGRVAELCAALAEALPRRALPLRAEQLQCFPPAGSVRVIAAELGGQTGELIALQQGVERVCRPLGFAEPGRRYHPHVTLARARQPLPELLRRSLSEAASTVWPGPMMKLTQFVLMESRLKPQAAEYVPLARFGVAE